MKKNLIRILAVIVSIFAFSRSLSFDYWKYKLFIKNDEIVFLEVDQDKIKTYQDLLNMKEFKGRPCLICVNTRFSYDFLQEETPHILKLHKNLNSSNINFIYTAIGLEDNTHDKMEWFIKMNELGLKGVHISLSDEFEEYFPLIIIKKDSANSESWNIPKYLIVDKNGVKTDTIYNFISKTNYLSEAIENKLKN